VTVDPPDTGYPRDMTGPTRTPQPLRAGTPLAAGMAGLALIGLGISVYLTVLKLAGTAPLCIPGGGCETVQTSSYSELFGVPVAAYGAAWSAVALAAAVRWWRSSDRRALVVLYLGGLAGTMFEAYLVYLELFVIHAICSWCAAYGATVLLGWLLTLVAMRVRQA
jgi:uncharacterized membrane protein